MFVPPVNGHFSVITEWSVLCTIETEGEWNGGGEIPLSVSLPVTNGTRIHRDLCVNSCYYHCYEGQRLTRFASGHHGHSCCPCFISSPHYLPSRPKL